MEYRIETNNNKRYIYLPELETMGLKHCFTTKDMDVGTSTNPDKVSLQGFINEAYQFMGRKPEILYNGYQAHTSNIEIIRFLDQGKEGPYGRFIPNTDGLLTDLNDVALLTRFADCVPIILFDKEKRIQGNIHSGWKGTLERIVEKGILGLLKEYGSSEEDILAVIGPAIGRDDFQVREDVGSLFLEEFNDWKELVRKVSEEKFLVDLQEINRRMLLKMGIDEKNITVIDISTYERDDLCHSYRRDKEDFGLMGLFTILEG
ncbi:polyphenol oxidase family protein [Gudongella sp. DL1XJH-153]|uniref:polyphenol oxidase family protein n=1 Tax=Gudongella sp. DL1XJH-153 TaxID=3409804 RepID=UPI003BB640D4